MITSIVCINLSEHKYYVYSLNGLLLNRINFSKEVEDYGEIIAISNNGQNIIMKKGGTVNDYFKLWIMHLNIFGLYKVKEINVCEAILKEENDQT